MMNPVNHNEANLFEFRRFLVPITFLFFNFGFFSNAMAVPIGHGCTKGIVLSSIKFKFTTRTLLGNEVVIEDPGSIIYGHIISKAKKDLNAAVKKENEFLKIMLDAAKTGKSYAEKVNLLAEFLSTAGLIVNEITMDIDYNCCNGTSESPENATENLSDLFLDLHEPSTITSSLKALPSLYVSAMVEAANTMVKDCPGVAH